MRRIREEDTMATIGLLLTLLLMAIPTWMIYKVLAGVYHLLLLLIDKL